MYLKRDDQCAKHPEAGTFFTNGEIWRSCRKLKLSMHNNGNVPFAGQSVTPNDR